MGKLPFCDSSKLRVRVITTGEGLGPSKCRPELDDGNLVTLARAFKETSSEFEYTAHMSAGYNGS
jgi:hypothetical protein